MMNWLNQNFKFGSSKDILVYDNITGIYSLFEFDFYIYIGIDSSIFA